MRRSTPAGATQRGRDSADEAIWLGRVLAGLLPEEPEALGLLALMLHCRAREGARRDAAGAFVPLLAQDPQQWSGAMVLEAEGLLRRAGRFGRPGRFQLEAAIQSVHADAAMTGRALGEPLLALYDALVAVAPSMGARVARAAALAELGRADAALEALDGLAAEAARYQPWWAARARALQLAGLQSEAGAAAAQAAALATDPSVQAFLLTTAEAPVRGARWAR